MGIGGFVRHCGRAVVIAAAWMLAIGQSAVAQVESAVSASQALTTESHSPAVVPVGTAVTLRVKQPISSRTAERGDLFEIELVNDIYIQALAVIPAGTKGMAQVVHASPKGFGGRAGELIVAARYLDVKGQRLSLRKTKFSSAGSDNAGAAIAATLAAPVIGMFVTGTSVDLPVGGIIVAETAQIFVPVE